MSRESLFIFLADTILVTHVLFVFFVIIGLAVTYLGYFLKWPWVRNRIFRLVHVMAIGVVVIQSWAGIICPLTIWEMKLRKSADSEAYSGSFIQYWLQDLLYYSAPEWVFILLYTAFGILVLVSWYLVRPNKKAEK